MRDPFHTIQDLPKAEKWMTKELLERHEPSTHRLLRSTKLSALVYRGFMTDGEKPENAPDDRSPINTDALAEDL